MRVQPWFASFMIVTLAVSASRVAAQVPAPPPSGAEGMPADGQYFAPQGGYPALPPGPPGPVPGWQPTPTSPILAGQGGGPGADPNRLAWPQISFFDFGAQTHQWRYGLWFLDQETYGRKYYFTAETFSGRVREPDDEIVGNPVVVNYGGVGTFPRNLILPNNTFGGTVAGIAPVDTGVLFNSAINDLDGSPGFDIFPGNTIIGPEDIDPQAVNEQRADPNHPSEWGVRLNWGFEEPAGNGFEAGLFYVPQANYFFQRGFGTPPGETTDLVAAGGLPLNDGTPTGTIVSFDRIFRLDYVTENAGAHATWAYTPMIKNDWFRFQTTLGMRYIWIGEQFSIFGAGSGLDGTFTTPPGIFTPSGLVITPPYTLGLNSSVDSHLIGPEIGMKFAIGGENLKIVGQTSVGAAANFEELKLSGRGVGDPLQLLNFGVLPPFDQDQQFKEVRNHARISPIAAANVGIEMNIFDYVPLLRKWALLEEARFRVGYNIVAAFEVHRPHRTIEYNGQPLTPTIYENERDEWYVHGYTMGLHWDY